MKVIIKKTERIFDDFFKIDEALLQYEKFDGTMSPELRRLNFNRGNSVAILLYNQNRNSLIFTKQFRYPVYANAPQQAWILEIIAGMIEDEQEPEKSAIREIAEETGYQVADLTFISQFFVSPGGTSEKIFLFFAAVRDIDAKFAGGGLAEEGEDIQVVQIPVTEALKMLNDGQFQDAKTIIALQWFEKNLKEIQNIQKELK
ncbi:NUDIX hydrolase [candidate division KSB1 bacterium]|nr:NUDIX hydrolase [candidate division KSB1 bacterium]